MKNQEVLTKYKRRQSVMNQMLKKCQLCGLPIAPNKISEVQSMMDSQIQ